MLRRAILLALVPAAVVPLLAGPASASCLDDLRAADLTQSDAQFSPSSHYNNLSYVEHTGTATAHVWGDDAIHDAGQWVTWTQAFAPDVAANVTGATTGFVNCVAG
jgi:hypothetical protein